MTSQNCNFKISNLHYMSIYQSCPIFTFYSSKFAYQWVEHKNIHVVGDYMCHRGVSRSNVTKKWIFWLFWIFDLFWTCLISKHLYDTCKHPQNVFFWILLIDTIISSHKTSKSDNFDKFTYNANLKFSNWKRGARN